MVHVGAGTGYYKAIMAHLVFFSTDKILLSNTDRACPLGLTVVQGDGAVWSFRVLPMSCTSMPVSRTQWLDTSRRVTRGTDLRSFCHIFALRSPRLIIASV